MASQSEIAALRSKRSTTKGAVTRLLTKGNALMSDDRNVTEVEELLPSVEETLHKFGEIHAEYHQTLTESADVEESEIYFSAVSQQVQEFRMAVDQWMADVKDTEHVSKDAAKQNENAEMQQKLQELQEEKERAMEEFRQEIDAQRQRLEREHQRLEEEHQLEIQRLQNAQVRHSTPKTAHTSRFSLGAIDESTVILDALKSIVDETKAQQKYLVDNLHTPKIELVKFDGDPLGYWPFIRAFDNMVASRTLDFGTKLNTFVQSCTGGPRSLLQCCLVKTPAEGYVLARRLLEERYGDSEVIAQAWLKRILDRQRVKSLKQLREFADDLRTCKETLSAMDYESELETRATLKAVVEKLADRDRDRWLKVNFAIKERQHRSVKMQDVIEFVDQLTRERSDPVFGLSDSQEPKTSKSAPRRNVFASSVADVKGDSVKTHHEQKYSPPQCPKCKASHYLNQCGSFRALPVKDRLAFTQKANLCVNCFRYGHKGRDCTKDWVCNVEGCGKKHNRWLHLPKQETAGAAAHIVTEEEPEVKVTTATTVVSHHKVALPIKPVWVKSASGQYIEAYALHDNCSSGSLCTDRLVEQLGLPTKDMTASFTTVNERSQEVRCKAVDLEIQDITGGLSYNMSQVLTRPSLNINIGNMVGKVELDRWLHLKDIDIPEVDLSSVDLLIGQDNPELLIPLDVREGRPGEPFAVKTVLGWGVNGPLSAGFDRKSLECNYVDMSLETQVERFWKIEEPFRDGPEYSISDKRVVSHWEDSIYKEGDKYCLGVPFKERPPAMPDNYTVVKHRLDLLGKRLLRDEDLRHKYTVCIKESLERGYAEEVPEEDLKRNDGYVWYLPHHPVTHPRKPDKVRVVFDCAARCQGTSLNDRVNKGPDLTNKLVGVLLRFRQEPIAVMADIEGMFNQVRVHPRDRDSLRFLWWADHDPTQPPKVYRMCTHLFGGVWSPSSASYALKRTAADHGSGFDPETVKTVDRNFYVDDCLKAVISEDVAIRLVRQLRELLAMGGFRLTKFLSNSREVLKTLPCTERCRSLVELDLDGTLPTEKALGIVWDVEEDYFGFESSAKEAPPTKRGLLSVLSSVFDPLGFVSPFVLQAKKIFQVACRRKMEWDEVLPDDIMEQWSRWRSDISVMAQMRVPRCFKPTSYKTAQVHIFSDACELGLGAVAYLRTTDEEGGLHSSLVVAKAKLAPLKATTIPRLELTAAVVSVRLDRLIREQLEIPLLETVYWTDSMIVLQYLRNEDRRFQTFVANRVAEIHSQSRPDQWRHVDTDSNPADDVSRGLAAGELIRSERWLHGPSFLLQSEEQWPKQPKAEELDLDVTAEVKREPQIYHLGQETLESNLIDNLLMRYSSWIRLKKAVAWILRLRDHLRKSPGVTKEKLLSVDELERAETAIITYVQSRAFATKEHLRKLEKLCPVEEKGILRVGGRLAKAPIAYSAQHPIILPNHHVTDLIIKHYHVKYGHSGTVRILAELRQKYWPLKGHATVKRVLRRCLLCKKMRATTGVQGMSDLPEDRVKPGDPPFSKVGVDYFGPFLVKRGRSEQKRYGCVFTCLATRAIHIEVSCSLDTDSFIHALQRFIARRGEPEEIRSDNGTNFVGARKELSDAVKDWNKDQIHDYLLKRQIRWIFNPPGASHMGGVWERCIRTIRSLILGLSEQQRLDDEGLTTLMCNVESVVNGRPLTRLSEDPTDPRPLTPNHLLLLRPGPPLPPGNFVLKDLYRRRWRQVQYLSDVFWRRWLKEYLPSLQERQKWLLSKRNLQPGDLVLISSENTPRGHWPLGLVVESYPGQDGLVRSAKIKTQTGLYHRPITKLCLLEADLAKK